jgi:hypothetical protein
MAAIVLKYRSSDGIVSERIVTDWRPDGDDAIDAYCDLRSERRTLKLMSILAATDGETGEVLTNPWRVFGLDRTNDGTERLNSVLADRLVAIKVLKLYAKTTRGFAKRERDHIVDFIQQNGRIHPYTRADIDAWLQQLWAGDAHAYQLGNRAEYHTLLEALPMPHKGPVKLTAERIARGSGRRAITPEAAGRIALEFGRAP